MADKLGEHSYQDYYDSVRGAAKEIIQEVKRGELGRDDIYDRIWETADGSYWVIYTHAALAALWFSDNWLAIDEAADEGIYEFGQASGLTDVITSAAFFAFRADVMEAVDADLEDVLDDEEED